MKTIDVRVERTICAPPGEVFDAWLDPKTPGTPWNMGDKMLLNLSTAETGYHPGKTR